MENKRSLSRELCWLLGQIFLVLGCALMTKANFGLSAIVAPAYLIHYLLGVSFGTAEYLFQALIIALMCLIIRRFRVTFLLSFFTAFTYGLMLDGALALIDLAGPMTSLFARLAVMAIGMVLSSLGVALFFETYLSPGGYELFVAQVAKKIGMKNDRFKLLYDSASLLLAVVLAFLQFGVSFSALVDHNISLGTLLVALFNGPIIGLISRLLHRCFTFKNTFPKLVRFFE